MDDETFQSDKDRLELLNDNYFRYRFSGNYEQATRCAYELKLENNKQAERLAELEAASEHLEAQRQVIAAQGERIRELEVELDVRNIFCNLHHVDNEVLVELDAAQKVVEAVMQLKWQDEPNGQFSYWDDGTLVALLHEMKGEAAAR